MKMFLLSLAKNLLGYWAAKLLSPEAVTEVLLTVAKSHAKNTKTETDDRLVDVIEKHINV
ncbi:MULTISPECIES: hypothetical protein [Vibrio]|uniref:hypothetical protein n=1 Tax=Vibrio TaxID=662 RepID=UPI001CDC150A|nr:MULTISPECIES: hypothetical protein [Vibrio]MCA2455820.1 hypothetical protein [Vibrio alginolyticus]MCA2461108.1 hypothetical protein [Vibrio alginolyticus]MDW2267487.1 hypothetical protein [Vibrio sp. 1394]MDW2294721.1 hypothetical protein [Vibrio sp. 1404]